MNLIMVNGYKYKEVIFIWLTNQSYVTVHDNRISSKLLNLLSAYNK